MNKLLIHATTWINLKIIALGERNQKKKRVHTLRFYLYKILENENTVYERKQIYHRASPLPWGQERVGGQDYKGASENFWGEGQVHYFHYSADVTGVYISQNV